MADVNVEVRTKEVVRALDKLAERGPKVMRAALSDVGRGYVKHITQTRLRRAKKNRQGEGLARRAGALSRALIFQTEITAKSKGRDRKGRFDGGGAVGAVKIGWLDAAAARIALVHEKGTVGKGGSLPDIVPRQRRYLAVPLAPALTKAGASRETSPRSMTDLVFIPFKGRDGGYLARTTGGKPLAFYLLLKKVAIPARLGFRKEWPRWMKQRGLAILLAHLKKAMKK